MKSAEIREAFLSYFERHTHTRIDSSSLIPGNDPTLLFTNAGMVQFKDVFLGQDKRAYQRATSSQRCVRAGGKHNDLENVGYTARHHTFFEMLGNFSFGDYFKREAIRFGWSFLTEELGIPAEKLWVTVYEDDPEAEAIWLQEMGIDSTRFSRLGEKDNFWAMGDTGPCGPCSEIFYDHGADVPGGPPGSPDEDGDRYIEIWNLVFMQFDRSRDGTLTPLPKPSVDTGMGLERIAAVMQGVHSNYEIDLFQNLLGAVQTVTGCKDASENSLKVIADHIRSCAFLILDGVLPSNEGRGYVLRRIIRRAVRHGHNVGKEGVFFHQLVAALAQEMGDAYPDLRKKEAQISKVLLAEEQQFARTLDQGMRILEQDIAALKGRQISGATAFKLYDTYGFPLDLTADIARERDLSIDTNEFDQCMEAQRQRARSSGKFKTDQSALPAIAGATTFVGYTTTSAEAKVVALIRDNQPVSSLAKTEDGIVVLDSSPFYAESGGQVGDCGELRAVNGSARFTVTDTIKGGKHHLHIGGVQEGSLTIGDSLQAAVEKSARAPTALNHSATHLLHAALRTVLGDHVTQKGSLVDSQRLRFDFSHSQALTNDELITIETMVNDEVRRNSAVKTEVLPIDKAKEKGALALFGEKYGDDVRVLTMGEGFSVELCGGTHAERTGDIGLLQIVAESGIAAGVRRIEAVTGAAALARVQAAEQELQQLGQALKADRAQLQAKLEQVLAQQRQADKQIKQLKGQLASGSGSSLADRAEDIGGTRTLVAEVPGADAKSLRVSLDQIKDKLGSAVILLAAVDDGQVVLTAGVSKDLTARYKAGDLIKDIAPLVGGKGGGRPDMAQGGGSDASGLAAALLAAKKWVADQ